MGAFYQYKSSTNCTERAATPLFAFEWSKCSIKAAKKTTKRKAKPRRYAGIAALYCGSLLTAKDGTLELSVICVSLCGMLGEVCGGFLFKCLFECQEYINLTTNAALDSLIEKNFHFFHNMGWLVCRLVT